jgi:hypothetical protein
MIHQPQTLADHVVYNLHSADNGFFMMPAIDTNTIRATHLIDENIVAVLFIDGSELFLGRHGQYVTPLLYKHKSFLISNN